ncbi:glycosyltransferase family 25 protein [Neiella marina]|nr:glycosyltransferase family 25 protein [Neiella marina]
MRHKVFVVNLKQSTERMQRIAENLNRLKVPFERFDAVYGKDLPDYTAAFDTKRFKMETLHDLVPGEAGCALSHIYIWQKMVAENIPYAIVIEDDAVVPDSFSEFLTLDFDELGFDYLKLDYPLKEQTAQQLDSVRLPAVVENRRFLGRQQQQSFCAYECDPVPFLTAGYLISLQGAKTFLRSSTNMYYPVDLLPLYTLGYSKQGFIAPAVVDHADDFDSMIPNRDFNVDKQWNLVEYGAHKLFNKARARKLNVAARFLYRKVFGSGS